MSNVTNISSVVMIFFGLKKMSLQRFTPEAMVFTVIVLLSVPFIVGYFVDVVKGKFQKPRKQLWDGIGQ